MNNTDTINIDYQVLARKYRPKIFSELIGQETLVNIITNAIKQNRVAHAYLLTGIRGVGKTTTARIIARALNCTALQKNNFEPCGKCESCISILEERNMDVLEMDAASRTGVDDVREIIENIKYKPTNCKYKIYIIDEVHMLSKNAFNALLKTLEEPPPHVKFLFATTEIRKVPITILSRCQRFDLFRIDNKLLMQHLSNITSIEKISISKEALALIIRASEGSVRDALSLLDQASSNAKEEITEKNIIKMLGLADRVKIYDLLNLIFESNAAEALKLFKNLYNQGADILMIFEEMIRITHFLTEIKILPTILKDSFISETEKNKAKEMSDRLTISVLGRFWQSLFKGYQELQNTNHLYQTSEMIVIRLVYLSDFPPPSDLIKKMEEKEKILDQTSYLKTNKSTDSDKILNEIQNISDKKIEKNNLKIKNKINSFRELVELFYKYREPLMYSKLYNQVRLISFEEGKLVINIDDLKEKNFPKQVIKLVSKWTGRIWTISLSDNKTGKTLAEEDIIIKENELEKVKKYPDIKRILDDFPGSKIHSIQIIDESEVEHRNEEIEKILEKK